MPLSDRHSIAARLRGLIAGQDRGDLAATARRLGVEELALRMSVDEDSPHPVIDVLHAVVVHHGIDPTWLLTGEYDLATHRAALSDDMRETAAALRGVVDSQMRNSLVMNDVMTPASTRRLEH